MTAGTPASGAPVVDAGVVRRHFVAIATGVYDDPAFDPLPPTR